MARATSEASTPASPSRDDAWLGQLTRTLTSVTRTAHSMRLFDAMGERAGLPIRPYLFGVLTRIHAMEPVRISDVADEMDYDRSTVSRHVAELVNLDCVTRETDKSDGRVVIVRLTDKGTTAVGQIFEAWMASLDAITSDWTEAEKTRFLKSFVRFDAALSGFVDSL